MTDECVMWCTTCGARFTKEEVAKVSGCPKCKTTSIPCDPAQDYKIEINWHELRLLGIWATHWANEQKFPEESKKTLRGIIGRLERQHPNELPLTLGGEIRQLRQSGLVTDIETDIPSEGFVEVHGPGAVGYSK